MADALEPLLVASTPDHIAANPGADYDKYTGTDYPYKPDPNTKIPDSVNLRSTVAYTSFFDNIYNQGHMGSCVGNSSAAMYRFEFKRHILDANIQNKRVIDPARLFIYYNARRPDKKRPIGDDGAENRDSLHGLEKYGVCEEATWKYVELRDKKDDETVAQWEAYKDQESSHEPNEAAYKEASNHTIKGYYRLDIDRDPKKTISDQEKENDGQHVAANIKACLSEGHPFIFCFFWPQAKDNLLWGKRGNGDLSFTSLTRFKAKHVKVPRPLYGHSVLGIGYDKDGVLCPNSWGANTATFWVPWEWITDYTATNDFWMIRVVGE